MQMQSGILTGIQRKAVAVSERSIPQQAHVFGHLVAWVTLGAVTRQVEFELIARLQAPAAVGIGFGRAQHVSPGAEGPDLDACQRPTQLGT
ncbi:MAG: hypothetical protein AMXMBFR33_12480 [Candidatus Xenobia bacterium]